MKNLQTRFAKLVEGKAIDVAKNSVGKSIPHSVHEVEVPAELKKINLDDITL